MVNTRKYFLSHFGNVTLIFILRCRIYTIKGVKLVLWSVITNQPCYLQWSMKFISLESSMPSINIRCDDCWNWNLCVNFNCMLSIGFLILWVINILTWCKFYSTTPYTFIFLRQNYFIWRDENANKFGILYENNIR